MTSENIQLSNLSQKPRPVPTNRRFGPPPSGVHLALLFVAVVVIVFGSVVYLNWRMNPLSYSPSEQSRAAGLLAAGKNIAVSNANIDWRELRRAHIRQMSTTPDVLIFGGSRWQEATSDVAPGKRVYNAFVSNDHFEDMMAISELLHEAHRLPKVLVLSVRYSTFEFLDRREAWWWKSFAPEYRRMAQRLGVPVRPWVDTLPIGKYSHLLSADAAFSRLGDYWNGGEPWRATDLTNDPTMDIVGSDGALHFSARRLQAANTQFAEKDALATAANDRTRRLKIDLPLLDQFTLLLGFLQKQGVEVVIIQTPFHPSYYRAIKGSAYFADIEMLEAETRRIAAKAHVTIAGGFDAAAQNCRPEDYRDFNHSSVDCLRRLVQQIPGLR